MLPKIIHIEVKEKMPRPELAPAGDYWIDGDKLDVRVLNLKDDRATACLLLHELVEVILALHKGVPLKSIDDFDHKWEISGKDGEPGDDLSAPYFEMHQAAEGLEKALAAYLGLGWGEYTRLYESL